MRMTQQNLALLAHCTVLHFPLVFRLSIAWQATLLNGGKEDGLGRRLLGHGLDSYG
jgi:hypothetical protein